MLSAAMVIFAGPVRAANIPPFFINSVVALGAMQLVYEPGKPPHMQWVTEGTGFFYGYLAKDDADPTKKQYEIYLVTAKHVVEGHPQNLGDMTVRVNPKVAKSPPGEFKLPTRPNDGVTWVFHDDPMIDIAIIQINLSLLRSQEFESDFFPNDTASADREKLIKIGASSGDGIFVLGFPMGLTGEQKNYVIVRQGIIARLNEMIDNVSNKFTIDSFVFPGNSGGPVVLKPELVAIKGTSVINTAYLIGVVVDYLPYTDIAVSNQTKKARISFEENSGLAEVIPMNFVDETIKSWQTKRPKPSTPAQ
jgi:S1-C subfamily serine protease